MGFFLFTVSGSEVYTGTLSADGKLVWDDGAIWVRVTGSEIRLRLHHWTVKCRFSNEP